VPAGFDPIVALTFGYPAETPPGNPRPPPVIYWSDSLAAQRAGDV